MLPPEDRFPLEQMLAHALEAQSLGANMTPARLAEERTLSLALVRLLEIVGEAAAAVSAPTREAHPDIPWREIVGMRNRLIHAYWQVDLEHVHQVLGNDLPGLVERLRQALESG